MIKNFSFGLSYYRMWSTARSVDEKLRDPYSFLFTWQRDEEEEEENIERKFFETSSVSLQNLRY